MKMAQNLFLSLFSLFLLSFLTFINSQLLYITGKSNNPLNSSLLEYWIIPSHLKFPNNQVKYIEVLFTGTLLEINENITIQNQIDYQYSTWRYGYGKIYLRSYQGTCIYMTDRGVLGNNPMDIPKSVSIAILCRINPFAPDITKLEIRPNCKSTERFCPNPIQANFQNIYPYENLISSTYISKSFEERLEKLTFHHSHSVCTVQTFRNVMSGPTLYLFAQYYLSLDWIVIIFDRFGDHSSYLSSLQSNPRLFYFPFTILTSLLPNIYNETYRSKQITEFMHFNGKAAYYKASRLPSLDSLKTNEEGNQNSDKRKTYNFARQLFHHFDAMLFVDRDELFFCPQGAPSFDTATETKMTILEKNQTNRRMTIQKEYQHNYINEMISNGTNRLSLPRVMYSSQSQNKYNDSKYYDSVISCLKTNNIYYEESFSEPNHIEHAYRIINCIGGKISIQDIKDNRKCIEMAVGGICPFNGIHTLCHKCRCVEKRPDSSRCHIAHITWIAPSSIMFTNRHLFFIKNFIQMFKD